MIRFLSILVFLFGQYAFGQKPQDAAFWTGVEQELTLNKTLEIRALQQLRLENNFRSYNQSVYRLGLKIDVAKWYKITPAIRFQHSEMTNWFRYQIDQTFIQDLPKKYWVKHRFRIQYADFVFDNSNRFRARYQLKAEKKLHKDLVVFLEPELFYRLQSGFNRFDQYRLEVGFQLEMLHKDALVWEAFYIYEEEFNRERPDITHIWGLQASLDVDKLYRLITTGSAKKNKQ